MNKKTNNYHPPQIKTNSIQFEHDIAISSADIFSGSENSETTPEIFEWQDKGSEQILLEI